MNNDNKNKALKLSDILKKPLSNGEEKIGSTPHGDTINKSIVKLMKSKDKDYILEELNAFKTFLNNEEINENFPNLIKEMKKPLKNIFNVPALSIGRETIKTPFNEVLSENIDMSSNLFVKMIDLNLNEIDNKNEVDFDISNLLLLEHLQSFVLKEKGENLSLLNSDVINKVMKTEEVKKSIFPSEVDNDVDSLVNGFKSMTPLMSISDELLKHSNRVIKKIDLHSINDDNVRKEEIEKNAKGDKILNEIVNKTINEIKIIEQQNLTNAPEDQKYKKITENKLFEDYISDMDIEGVSDYKLNKDFINEQEKEQATVQARIKEDDELKNLEESQYIFDSARNQKAKFFKANNLVTTAWIEQFQNKNKSHGTNNNILLESINTIDKWGSTIATVATINQITGKATIGKRSMTNPIALQAVIYRLMEKNPPKEGESFNLHIGFRGDKSIGNAYVEAMIETAINSKPPIGLDNIHVPKEYRHILEAKREENEFLASASKLPENELSKKNDTEYSDLQKAEENNNNVEKDIPKENNDVEQNLPEKTKNERNDVETDIPAFENSDVKPNTSFVEGGREEERDRLSSNVTSETPERTETNRVTTTGKRPSI